MRTGLGITPRSSDTSKLDPSSTNFVPGDTNGLLDYFVVDRTTNAVERVNVDTSGAQVTTGTAGAGLSISADGHFTAFGFGEKRVRW